jgi:hypothetical protein
LSEIRPGLAMLALTMLVSLAHAADKIVLVCSGTATFYWNGMSTNPEGPDGLVIDLDGGVVTWGDEAIPITSIKGNFI